MQDEGAYLQGEGEGQRWVLVEVREGGVQDERASLCVCVGGGEGDQEGGQVQDDERAHLKRGR